MKVLLPSKNWIYLGKNILNTVPSDLSIFFFIDSLMFCFYIFGDWRLGLELKFHLEIFVVFGICYGIWLQEDINLLDIIFYGIC